MLSLSIDTGILGSQARTIHGIPIIVTEPTVDIVGITFLITGANMPLTCYKSIRQELNNLGQVVVDYNYKSLALHSLFHTKLASSIMKLFPYLQQEFTDVEKFGVIGHSIGGKIALMMAAMAAPNDLSLEFVLALDPIDKGPVQIVNGSMNFDKSKFPIFVTHTGSVMRNGALDIYSHHMNNIKILYHTGAGHLAYCDGTNELSYWKQRQNQGTEERNEAIKKQTIKIIKNSFRWEKRLAVNRSDVMSFRMSLSNALIRMDLDNLSTPESNSSAITQSEQLDEELNQEPKPKIFNGMSFKVRFLESFKQNDRPLNDEDQQKNKKDELMRKKKGFFSGLKKTGNVMGKALNPLNA